LQSRLGNTIPNVFFGDVIFANTAYTTWQLFAGHLPEMLAKY